MKMQKSNIAYNLATLRQLNKFSQEEVANRIGVSRQAVAKWESGQSVPDILNCDALAKLYDVELDDLIHYDQGQTGESIPPKGKHIFGTVRVGERGQIVLPKKARDVFKIKPGDMLVVLGDEEPEHPGIALMKEDFFLGIAQLFKTALNMADTPDGKEKKMEAVLSAQSINKHYPGFTLENVSFSLAPNRIMGLIGKNGAGKSTTLKAILNMVSPESGSVTMFQKNFYQHEKECKQRIGVVFGGIDFYPLKKLSTITAVTRKFYTNWDEEQYQKNIRRFSLNESKKFKELSNGMKVKYLLALALSHHAELLILDEPTSGLDPVSREELLHIFRQIVKSEKCSILFSTHITSDLDRCADDITYIQNGRVLQSADKDTFLRSFEHLKTPDDTRPLTLEEIMLRTERSEWDDDITV